MATFKMPNISKINSQMRKVKAASSQLERETTRSIRELKNLERKARSYQRKLQSSSIPALKTMP